MEKHNVGPERIWIWKTGPLENSESLHWSMELHASELNAQVRVDANKGSTILAEGACDKGHLVLTVCWAWLLSRTSLLVTSLLTCYLLLTCYYLLTWTCYFITNITELKNKTKPAQKLISRDSWMDPAECQWSDIQKVDTVSTNDWFYQCLSFYVFQTL